MGAYGSDDSHERFLRKNIALSRAYEVDKRDRLRDKKVKGDIKPLLVKCHKCKETKLCLPFKMMETGHYDGVASVSNEIMQLCELCAPKKKAATDMNSAQIRALMRNVKKGLV